ncbi:MAG: TspO/MBR family protein [Aureliella sp.]
MKITKNYRSKTSLAFGLIVSLAICFSAAALGGLATTSSVNDDWFANLNKPSWNPPNWIFGPVWSALYLMMAIAAWLVWKQSGFAKSKGALIWFGLHLILNILWSVLFFALRQPSWAAIEILILWISIAVSIMLFSRHSKLAAGLLTPYLAWVTFAAFLNMVIWSLNQVDV